MLSLMCLCQSVTVFGTTEHLRHVRNILSLQELTQAVGKLLLQFEKPRDSLSQKANISQIIQAIESISAETIPTPSQPVVSLLNSV